MRLGSCTEVGSGDVDYWGWEIGRLSTCKCLQLIDDKSISLKLLGDGAGLRLLLRLQTTFFIGLMDKSLVERHGHLFGCSFAKLLLGSFFKFSDLTSCTRH